MSTTGSTLSAVEVHYPDSDGRPMSDNTLQWQWMVTIKENLEAIFRDDPDVFVAGDLLWYPVEGSNTIRIGPDVLVAFGRPKGHRGSYMQWREGGIPPQVVFEILSPGNRLMEMMNKFRFYEQHGVEEYYVYDPETREVAGSVREGDRLIPIPEMNGWISPRLGIRFEAGSGELRLFRPDGQPFVTFVELTRRVEAEQERAEAERQRAEAERQRAEAERQRAERLAEQLRALGIEPSAS